MKHTWVPHRLRTFRDGNLIKVLAQVSVTLVKAKSTDSKLPKGPQSNMEFKSKSVPLAGNERFCGPPFRC